MNDAAPSPIGTDAAAHFVAKWLAAAPEMQFARLFCPAPVRQRFDAWGALLHELQQARIATRDASVAMAKTAWWSDELRALAGGSPRHPLTLAVRGIDAPWPALARALLAGAEAGDPFPGDVHASLAQLQPVATAVAEVEGALFDSRETADAARAMAVHWRLHALPRGLSGDDGAGLPMDLLARHALTRERLGEALPAGLLRDWAVALADALPRAAPGAPLSTQARLRFDRRRLARLAKRGDVFDAGAGPGLLWQAWRAGRAARARGP